MQFTAYIHWQRKDLPFNPKSYDRTHTVKFGGGKEIEGCSAPDYLGKAELPNPEELFTASLSSCLMLTFLYLASVKGFVIDDYSAEALGTLSKNSDGKMAMTEVIVKPKIKFAEGKAPSADALQELFNKAHEGCFISNSVKTKVSVVGDDF